MEIWEIKSRSVEETEALGEALGQAAKSGDVITLDGDLGAGKTAFTRGLARGMGLRSRVTSPTFTIVNEYNDANGVAKLFHFDTYRLSSSDDFYDAGLDEYFDRDGVCAIEWSSVIEDALPEDRIAISISGTGDERTIKICYSAKDQGKIDEVKKQLDMKYTEIEKAEESENADESEKADEAEEGGKKA